MKEPEIDLFELATEIKSDDPIPEGIESLSVCNTGESIVEWCGRVGYILKRLPVNETIKYIPQRDGRFGFPLGGDQDRVYMDPWGMRNVKDTEADISIYGGPSLRWLSRLNKDERAYVTYSSVEDSWVLIIEF